MSQALYWVPGLWQWAKEITAPVPQELAVDCTACLYFGEVLDKASLGTPGQDGAPQVDL